MKKALSILLVLIMLFSLFSLAACSKKEEAGAPAGGGEAAGAPAGGGEAAGGEIDLANTKPNEYIQEKLDAGMEPLIYFAAPLLTDTFVVGIMEGIGEEMKALGFSYSNGDCQGDQAKMIDVVENAVTMQASCIIVMAFVQGLGDVCAAANEAGSSVVVFGAKPEFEVDGMVWLDQGEQGYQAGKMISAWADLRYPDAGDGELKVLLMPQYGNEDNVARSDGYERGLAEDPRFKIAYSATETVQSVEEGFNYAQEGFSLDPEIRIVLTFSISTAIGANNYIISHFPDQLDEFGVFCNSQDPALMELIAKSAENDGSCIRGTIAQGGDVPYEMVAQCVKDVMLGGAEFGYILPDRTYSVTSFEYHYDSREAA